MLRHMIFKSCSNHKGHDHWIGKGTMWLACYNFTQAHHSVISHFKSTKLLIVCYLQKYQNVASSNLPLTQTQNNTICDAFWFTWSSHGSGFHNKEMRVNNILLNDNHKTPRHLWGRLVNSKKYSPSSISAFFRPLQKSGAIWKFRGSNSWLHPRRTLNPATTMLIISRVFKPTHRQRHGNWHCSNAAIKLCRDRQVHIRMWNAELETDRPLTPIIKDVPSKYYIQEDFRPLQQFFKRTLTHKCLALALHNKIMHTIVFSRSAHYTLKAYQGWRSIPMH